MIKRFLSKSLVLLLAVLMVLSSMGTAVFAAVGDDATPAAAVPEGTEGETPDKQEPEQPQSGKDETEKTEKATKLQKIKDLLDSSTYEEYRVFNESKPDGVETVIIDAAEFDPDATSAEVFVSEWCGEQNALIIPETGDVTFRFTVSESGNYQIGLRYAPVDSFEKDGVLIESHNSAIQRALLLDGTYPFKESRDVQLSRIWKDVSEGEVNERGFQLDNDGNELKPKKVEAPAWGDYVACDSTGYVVDPFLYYIEAGEHTLTLAEVQECFALKSIVIFPAEKTVSYEEYRKSADSKPNNAAGDVQMIEAEKPLATSSNIIYPAYDRSSASTSPQSASNIYLNTIGGEKWETVGQWVQWEIEVPEDGYYLIVPRYNQSFAEGMYVTRTLKIDGQVPFEEAKFLRFKYDDDWQLSALTDGVIDEKTGEERELYFYLEKGKHNLELSVSLGTMAKILSDVAASSDLINDYYLQVLMLTGSDPDEYMDYKFSQLMPEVLKGMLTESKKLYAISAQLEEINGTKGSDSVTLDNVALLLERMGKDEDLIAPNFDEWKDYIGSLGTWVATARNQPLEVDYLLLVPQKKTENTTTEELLDDLGYESNPGFFKGLGYEFKQFLVSWVNDYSTYGVRTDGDISSYKSIEVWTTSGRDQAQIMRSLVSDSFTQQYNVAVEIKLVAAGSLLPATLSGMGPDVHLATASATVINYAIRKAVVPINPEGYADKEGDTDEEKAYKAKCREIFKDYDEVKGWFADAATIPLELYGVAYGLPQTEHFSMMFYRSDILLQLGLDIPDTWDDVYNMLPTLQTNNLEFGYHESLAGLLILLYQRGEQLYKGENRDDIHFGMQINLDSNTSLETFKDLCEMYTMYGFPYSYNFVNRFRTGEMPIGCAQYTIYSQLILFAPELRGLWGFTVLPGTLRAGDDGEAFVDHTADTTIAGVVMLRDCEEMEAAWSFMKWFVSEETQATYAQEYYALLGASGQYATANINALKSMSWTAEERGELERQFKDFLRATPEMPGGYIVTRYVEFAFLRAYEDDEDPVEALLDYIDTINAELSRKRTEFELPTYEEFVADGGAESNA